MERLLSLIIEAGRAAMAGDAAHADALAVAAAALDHDLRRHLTDAGRLIAWEHELLLEHGIEPPAHRTLLAHLRGELTEPIDVGATVLRAETQREACRDWFGVYDETEWVRLADAAAAFKAGSPFMHNGRALPMPASSRGAFMQAIARLKREHRGEHVRAKHATWPPLWDLDYLDPWVRAQQPWLIARLPDRLLAGDWINRRWFQRVSKLHTEGRIA